MTDLPTAFAVLSAVALLPACAGEGPDTGAGTHTVRVTLRAFRIEMPDTLPPGATTFRITNRDTLEHSFRLEEQVQENLPANLTPDRIDEELESNLAPGQTGTLVVDLRPGDFETSCPLADHEPRGMRRDVAVGFHGP